MGIAFEKEAGIIRAMRTPFRPTPPGVFLPRLYIRTILATVLGLSLLQSASVLAAPAEISPWSEMRPATCMPDDCFCEADRGGWIRQPANTLSSLGFILAAMAVLLFSAHDLKHGERGGQESLMRRVRVLPALYASSLLLIGIGTGFYHASLSFVGQTMDVLGMYLLATLLLLYGTMRIRPLPEKKAALIYVLANLILLWVLVAIPELRRYIFALLILGVVLLEIRLRKVAAVHARARFFVIAIATLAVGFIIWVADLTRTSCSPTGAIQGHAIWHVLGAISSVLIFLYFRSERYGADRREEHLHPRMEGSNS